jgi:hypothetical protein
MRNLLRRGGALLLAAMLALGVGQADATVYFLLNGATATSSAPTGTAPTAGGTISPAQPNAPTSGQAVSSTQSFVINVDGTDPNGSVSCTVQLYGSNDGAHWATYGSAVTASGTAGTGTTSATGTVPYLWFAAAVTAISGTGAKCSVRMNA